MKFTRSASILLLANLAIAQVLSPPAKTETAIDGKKLSIAYSSPSIRGRKIMGGLVPYGTDLADISSTANAGWIKCRIGSTERYIPLYAAKSS